MNEIKVDLRLGPRYTIEVFVDRVPTAFNGSREEFVSLGRYVRKGDKGDKGDPGVPGGALVEKTAMTALGGHRAVRSSGETGAVYADNRALVLDNVLGITVGAAAQGDTVSILNNAPITEPSWNWEPDQAIFLGENGVLTQDVPETAGILAIGFALSPTTAMIRIEPPIYPED